MVEPYSAKKAKKALFIKLSIGLASLVVLIVPLAAQAGVLSIFTLLFEKSAAVTSAQGVSLNSQTIPLLQPAINLDPNPAKGGGDITVVDGAALVALDGPSGTPADTSEKPQSSQISVYTVRSGDTLSGIAEMFDVTVNTIIWANDIKGRVIHPGDMLIILPVTGLRHTVAKGETLASIAKTYKGDAAEIASYNELAGDAALTVGSVVIIPNGEAVAVTASASAPSKIIASIPKTGTTAKLHDAGGPDLDSDYVWPLDGGVITQGLHGYNAVDIGAPKGTPIFAAAAGTVIIAKDNGAWNGGYGNYIVIQHSNGTQTLYAHASSISVSPGDQVAQGQTIGRVGRTGEATGYHLHFEVRGAKNPFGK
ncbi:MAG TPA: peptidoglycan DD-metalloendopeptidase family protein [Candidatus Paceibacterota bacterium]|nr:peptidoglycan DD-metalloendopeptidase family protein [Candidatus Paceibacterota bacterium]